jgi:hypothetical protein
MDMKDDKAAMIAGIPTGSALIAYSLHNWQVLYWGLWITAFLAVELPAVFNGRLGDTFSETWWRWLHIRGGMRPTPDGRAIYVKPLPLWLAIPIRIVIVGFGVWLIMHLGFGWWGGY